ncbi:MAG: helix-turn-helix transcriptional regulator [Thermoprotei archaeon]
MAYERAVRNITTNLLWLYVIALLKERRMYAYEIAKEISNRFGFKVATVTVYSVLYKMEHEGLVKSAQSKPFLKPSKRFYELTEKGDFTWSSAIDYIGDKLSALKRLG